MSKEAMKLALEALESERMYFWNSPEKIEKSITALREALAEQPAQRAWVGLSDEEITDMWAESSPYYHEDDFARAIEAKLKERNQ